MADHFVDIDGIVDHQ